MSRSLPFGLADKNVVFVNCGQHAACPDYLRHFDFVTVINGNDYKL
jgi:hypothetical protein